MAGIFIYSGFIVFVLLTIHVIRELRDMAGEGIKKEIRTKSDGNNKSNVGEEAEKIIEVPPSLNLAFEWVKDVLVNQGKACDVLETKATTLFTLATAVLGVGVTAGVLSSDGKIPFWSIIFGSLSLAAYGFVIGYALVAIKLHKFETLDNPVTIREWYWDMQPSEFKIELLSHLEDSYKRNETYLSEKANATRLLMVFTAVQILLLVVSLTLLR